MTPPTREPRAERSELEPVYARPYAPWSMQRKLHRSRAPIRVVVAGRQSGKTHAAAEEVVRLILARPGSESCLLMPTYKSTKAAKRHLDRAVKALGKRTKWKEVDKCYVFANGAVLYVRTAEDKDGVPTRGLTLDGVLWVDEAGYVPRSAWEAARLTQAAVGDPRVLVTGTPCGRNWLYEEWRAGLPGPDKNPLNESFRFRSLDSPFCNAAFVADLKKKLGTKRALQELSAQFLGDAGAAFNPEDIAALFTGELPVRGEQRSLGVDFAKEKDFTVCTLMNEYGEAWVLGRWQHVSWPDTEAQVSAFAREHRALVVLDLGHGGGYGGAMKDYLERDPDVDHVLAVRTGNLGVKAQLCEALISDVENRRLRVAKGELTQHLRHELTYFESHSEVVGGTPRTRYHGPQGSGEDDHDDCVISLALANWGRLHGWEGPQGETEDLREYVEAAEEIQTLIEFQDRVPCCSARRDWGRGTAMFSRVFEDLLADDTLTGLVARFADHATEHACTGLFHASARPLRPGGSTATWDEVRLGRHLAPVTGPDSPHPRAEPLGTVRRQCALASIKLYKDVPAAHLFLDPTPNEDVRRRAETLLAQELLDLGTLIANTREYLAASALLGRIEVNERTVPGSDVAFTVEFRNRRARALTSWADPNARLRSAELLRLKRLFKDEAGRRAGVALTEPGVDSAFVQNEELKAYAARKLGAEILANLELTGTNPQWEGLAGLSWRFTDGTYRPEGGAVTRYFPRETVVVLPEAERLKDVLGWAEGRVFVPRGPRHVLDVQLVTDVVRERRGVYAYAEVRTDPCAIRIYAGWTGLPVVLDPSAVLVYRTAVPAGVP